MIYDKEILGDSTKLRPAKVEDAAFILSLRLNTEISMFLRKTDPDIDKQNAWIIEQQGRKGDFYFIISDIYNNPKGTISIYNIDQNRKEGELGRWICWNSSLHALESMVLVLDFAFNTLDLKRVYSLVMKYNIRARLSHEKFGYSLSLNPSPEVDKKDLIEYEIFAARFEEIKKKDVIIFKKQIKTI